MILLCALLLAAPERVVMVAKPLEKPGVFAKLSRALGAAARRLYEKNDPDVDEGNTLAAQNDAEGALKAYDRALQRSPDAPELHFNRANALLKLGSGSAPEAGREAAFALEHGNASLKPRAAFDLGLADEAMGRSDDAVKAYQRTLALDPDDVDAKVNLELLLRSQEEKKQKQQVGQEQPDKPKQEGNQQQPKQSQGGEQKPSPQKQAGNDQQEPKPSPDQNGEQPEPRPDEKRHAQAEQKPVDRSEAERLLDALRADEKNLQPWRFARELTKEKRRSNAEKDW
jgi:tetratricopeptide (TPR) repeat protein